MMKSKLYKPHFFLVAALAFSLAACIDEGTPDTTPPGGNGGSSGGGSAGSSGGGSAGSSGGGSAGSSGGGSGGGSTTSTAYCDGFAAADGSNNKFNVQTFAFNDTLKSESCSTVIAAYTDGTSLSTIIGVFDLDTGDNGSGSPAPALLVGNCSDLGLSGFSPTSGPIVVPQGAVTVAAAYGSATANLTVYGVVTAVEGWGPDSDGDAENGTVYIQDATAQGAAAAAKSGSQIYFSKTYETTYGTVPSVGDVISVTGLKWSPYEGVNEFETSSTTTVTKLGTSTLPTPVGITAAQASQSAYLSSSGYEGMRVAVTGGPFKVSGSAGSNTCPTQLEYTPTSGSSGGSGGGSSGGSGGGSAGGSSGGSAGGSAGGSGGGSSSAYCDGMGASNPASTVVNVQTYEYGKTLTAEGCATTVDDYTDGTSLSTVAGIFDLDTSDNGAGSPAPALILGNCSDLGLPGFTATTTAYTPPSGALTVAAAFGTGTTAAPVTVYGVVTAVYGWADTSGTATGGSLYIEDMPAGNAAPAVKSGTQIYFSKTYESTYGAVPSIGDVISVSGLDWDPYKGVNEFATSSTTVVTKLGTSPLPPAVPITAANSLSATYLSNSGYQGMRVSISDGPLTVHGSDKSGTCPTQLQYTSN